jgi:hypothetical protein
MIHLVSFFERDGISRRTAELCPKLTAAIMSRVEKQTGRIRQHPPDSRPSKRSTFGKARKSMTSSVNTTRRGFLSTAAALAASAAVAIPANGADASTPDPIFEAIETHKAARLAFKNAVSRGCALERELPRGKTRSWIMDWEEEIVETDDPRWIDSVREIHRTSEAATDAACALANVAPTTMAGVVGLLQYAISFRPEEWPEGVESDDDTETRPWHTFLIETLIAVLPGMAVPS